MLPLMAYTTPSVLLRSPFQSLNWVDDLVDDLFEPRMEVWPSSRLHHSFFNRQMRDMQKELQGWADQRLQALNQENAEQKIKLLEDNENEFRLNLGCQQFKPEEIECKADGHYLTVEGKHEEKDEKSHNYVKRHFVRRVLLPENAEVEKVECRFKPDGVLSISIPKRAPAIEQSKDRVIPIQHEKPAAVEAKK